MGNLCPYTDFHISSEENYDCASEVDKLNETSILEFTEVVSMPVENGSSAVLQTPTCSNTQPDTCKPSTFCTGSQSVWTQTGNEYMNQSSIPKHQAEYGPHKRFSRKYKEWLHKEELGHNLLRE